MDFVNQITWMVVVQEPDFGFPAQQVLHQGNKYIKPVPPIVHITKIILSGAIKNHLSCQCRHTIMIQLLQVLLGELTMI